MTSDLAGPSDLACPPLTTPRFLDARERVAHPSVALPSHCLGQLRYRIIDAMRCRSISSFSHAAVILIAIAFLCCASAAHGAIVTDPTVLWTPVQYASPAQSDFQDDQQTGNSRSSSDIVGDVNSPAFLMQFDDGGTSGVLTDGSLLFRVRLGAAGGNSTPVFDRNLFVGLDGDGNGSLDLYVGVHNQGSMDELAIYGPGSDSNTSPNTTSITGPLFTFAQSPSNYDYSVVDTADTDLDGDGETDYFLSFAMPFQSVVDWMLTESGVAIDQNSSLSYVMATATQDNSFNQDINGLPKDFDSSSTWTTLGALSTPSTPISASISAVPEPSLAGLMALFTMTILASGRRRRWR